MRCGWRVTGTMLTITAAAPCQTPCATCHAAIAQSYRTTGMGRSFFRPAAPNTIEDYSGRNTYYHAQSDTYFEMIRREGSYFQRQYQLGFQGKQVNVTETSVDFVMGSGNHARTYLHRSAMNELMELPLGWYAESGGYWAMNPGYDRPYHAGLNRAIPYGCMFCHNGYPEIPAGQGPRSNAVFLSVPEGIDCQRCHGNGREHVRLASTAGSRPDDIRKAIVNPARLPADRRMDVCLQCHLEANSASSSNLIVRYERGPFSFRPGEPLGDFRLHFDQVTKDASDRFEIVGASAYRLRQSQCFLQSHGSMTCTTCHDPHRAGGNYSAACLQCHEASLTTLIASERHTASRECIGCHMPKRRTSDAVHVVMTDHYIQRRKPERDLLAAIAEQVHSDSGGAVVPYDPPAPARPADELYLGTAQVDVASARSEGIARLAAAIAKFQPAAAEYYLQLGEALRASRRYVEAIAPYEEAVRHEPESAIAHERLALGLTRVRQFARADAEFQQATKLAPRDVTIARDLGLSYLEQGRMPEAVAAFQRCLALDPNQPEAHNGLGGARLKTGDHTGAEAEFREAIRLRPHYTEAHHNLAFLLGAASHFDEAAYHFEEALRINPGHIEARFDYAAMLEQASRAEDARQQIETLLRADPGNVRAHDFLGGLLQAKGQSAQAIAEFREAVRLDPEFARANLDLGAALAAAGQSGEARLYLEKAAQSREVWIRDHARQILETIR